jgi:hypothetical protein
MHNRLTTALAAVILTSLVSCKAFPERQVHSTVGVGGHRKPVTRHVVRRVHGKHIKKVKAPKIAGAAGEIKTVRFAWSPSPDASVTGYKFFIGIKPTEYTDVTDVGNVTQAEADLLQGSTYFASVTAHNAIGLESLPAPELAFNTPILNESPTPNPTATPAPTAIPTATSTPSPVVTPSPSPSSTPSPTQTPDVTPNETPNPSPTATVQATATPTPSPVVTASPSPVPSATPQITPTPTATVTPTPTPNVSPTPSASPSVGPQPTASPSATVAQTPSPTSSPGPSSSPTLSPTPSVSPSGTPTATVSPTATPCVAPHKRRWYKRRHLRYPCDPISTPQPTRTPKPRRHE